MIQIEEIFDIDDDTISLAIEGCAAPIVVDAEYVREGYYDERTFHDCSFWVIHKITINNIEVSLPERTYFEILAFLEKKSLPHGAIL